MTKTTYALESKKRSDERRQDLIANRQIPAIVYGPNIKENEKISIDYSDFIRLYRQTGQNKIIDLKTEKSTIKVLIQTVQQHPVSDDFIHIDFYAIDPSKKILVNIPLVFHGESNAVKNLNADLNLSIEKNMIDDYAFGPTYKARWNSLTDGSYSRSGRDKWD